MHSSRSALLPLVALAVTAALAGCSSDATGDSGTSASDAASEATSTTASTAPPTAPVADPVAAVQACLDGADLATEPESDPRFGADAELQVAPSGGGSYLGVFVYDTPETASAHENALKKAGASSTEVIGTVVLAGTLDAPAGEATAVAAVQGCAAATVQ